MTAPERPAADDGDEVERVGFCTCEPGLPMRDCGIPGHRFVARRLREPAPVDSNDVAIEDVRAIAVALGLGGHARPYSAHDVVTREILPALAARRPATEAEEPEDALTDALRVHHPIMRSETGPFSGCRCGQVRLGENVIAHVVAHLVAALDQP